MKRRDLLKYSLLGSAALALPKALKASSEIHVSKDGKDSNSGGPGDPYLTINRAASAAQAGDTVIVHAGTYREWVKPLRSGTGENARIIYKAAKNEKVIIKGSEQIKNWKRENKGVWKVEIPNSFFGKYNPYALKLTGGWLHYGKWHHRGNLHLNGKAFLEKEKEEEVSLTSESWFCATDKKRTLIKANFGKSNPNREIVEINLREALFMPKITGLKYITVDGFHFLHAASNWSPPNTELQPGAVGTRMGKRWIIQNCTITDCRTVGIILGKAPGMDYADIDAYGDHIIRNNIIKRCGQAGIAGLRGATRSLIEGNFIEDTNPHREFGGCETAAIKFHYSVDTIISRNLIRGVFCKSHDAHGIWLDNGNQSARITGNIIYNTQKAVIYLEINHGPILVDNNILIGKYLKSNSRAGVFAHNLFINCAYLWDLIRKRKSYYYTPHTAKRAGLELLTDRDNKLFYNIFIRSRLDKVKEAEGFQSDYNLFLRGAKKSSFGDKNSIVDSHNPKYKIKDQPFGVTVTFSAGNKHRGIKGPWVDEKLVGVFKPAGQSIEDRHGNPITVDRDINGRKFVKPVPGPLADLKPGLNTISWGKLQ